MDSAPDFIPDSAAPPDQAMAANTQSGGSAPDFISDDEATAQDDKYSGIGQQVLGTAEALGRGVVGHTLTSLAEKGLTKAGVSGLSPEEQTGREEYLKSVNPLLPGAAEAAGFGAGMLTGTGEAALLGKAGEAVHTASGLAKSASISSRLAAGAVKTGTELALMQADDEVSKAVNGTSGGVGDAIASIGLAGAMGAAGGGVFSGLGMAGKGALDAIGLKEFADRLAFRGANLHPNEMMEKEFNDAISQYHAMGDELTGPQGLRAQALEKIMPKEMTPEISGQIQKISDQAQNAIKKMADQDVSPRYMKKFVNNLNDFQGVATDPNASVGQVFDAMNSFKKDLQAYSKGNWGPFAIPSYHEAYDFLNITKTLSHDVRTALEEPGVWGKVGELQKQINASWSKSLPAVKDVQSKFMEKVGGEYVPSPQKFSTYLNQNGKATSETIRQKMMGNFVDSLSDHFKATDAAYKAAGVENPFQAPGLGSLKESVQKSSIGKKLADLWYDKLGHEALGSAAGAAVGEALLPGFGGAYVGKEVLGKPFGAIIKPISERVSKFPAYIAAMKYVKGIAEGDKKLATAAATLFKSGSKTIPSHWVPDAKELLNLDEHLKKTQNDPSALYDATGQLPHYLPANSSKLAETTARASQYLNSIRPSPIKPGPLDKEIEPSKAQEAGFQRQLAIAQQPLMALHHIENGTLLPQDVVTLKTVYPEYYQKMSEKLLTAMSEHVHEGGTVPYQTRQSLSLFLAQPLDSTMTPASIQSIQSTYAQGQSQQQANQAEKPKKSTAPLNKVATNLQTQGQAREARQNKA